MHALRVALAARVLALVAAGSLASQSVISGAPPASTLTGCESLPTSLLVDPQVRLLMLDMRRRSPTFRRQVIRIVDQPGLAVVVGAWQLRTVEGEWAHTQLTRTGGLLRTAEVQIRLDAPRSPVELIAHEFEHILEQLDGIDLIRWVGRGGVTQSQYGAIETERAIRLGRIVAGEYAAMESKIAPCGARS